MPQVPRYDGPQVREQALPIAATRAPDVSSDLMRLGQGLGQVSDAAFRIEDRNAQTQAWQAQAKINDEYRQWYATEAKNAQGSNAAGLTARATQWWDEAKNRYAKDLSPMAQRYIGKTLATVRNASLESANNHENQQLEIGEKSALMSSLNSLSNQAVASGPDKAGVVLDEAVKTLRSYGVKKGVDVEPDVMKLTTGTHVTLINQLLQKDPKAAELYFNTNKKQISADQWDNIGAQINHISAVSDGESAADKIWQSNVKGGYNSPVDMFAMEKQMREQFSNDPNRQKAGIQALRDRTAAWNKSQLEYVAANTNSVYGLIDQGVPLTRVMRSNAWTNLPEAEQHKIQTQLESQALTRAQRESASDARRDRQLLLQNADEYLSYSNPEVLASMSRPQVQALRSKFGFDGTQHLLNRYDSLQKPGAIAEAKMDQDDFNHVATEMGLNPYQKSKAELGELKYRTEQLINKAQQQKKATLTRDEKMDLMRDEMARTVTVDGYFSNTEKPVIALTPKEVQDVIVPKTDREQIVKGLQVMYAKDPNNPAYAPTEDNIRSWFLKSRSRAAGLISQKK